MPRKFKVLPNIFLLILFAALLTGCVNEVSGVGLCQALVGK